MMVKVWMSAGGPSPEEIDYANGSVHLKLEGEMECVLDCDIRDTRKIRETLDECLIRTFTRISRRATEQFNEIIKNRNNEGTKI